MSAGLGWAGLGGVCEEETIDVPLTDHQPTSSQPWALMSRYILQPSDKPEILDIRYSIATANPASSGDW